jgi:hypothetical protein
MLDLALVKGFRESMPDIGMAAFHYLWALRAHLVAALFLRRRGPFRSLDIGFLLCGLLPCDVVHAYL